MLPSCMARRITPEPERFWPKVDKTEHCWNWTAYTLQGYGRFGVGDGKVVYAHRWAYEYLVGPIPEGLTLDHLCRNRACVNPDHLEPVTPAENTRRGGSALKTHCPKGHPYSGDNLVMHPDGSRRCRECNRLNCERRARAKGVVPIDERTHCRNGHQRTPENTYIRPSGARRCRECAAEATRRYQARKGQVVG